MTARELGVRVGLALAMALALLALLRSINLGGQ